MAFDFPASPTEGQEFTPPSGPTYVFTSPVWKFKNIPAGATVYVGDNPPAAPFPGMLWWDSDLGSLYIYYADGTSSQWVQANINASVLADFVKKSGDTMTGDLTISKGAGVSPNLILNRAAPGFSDIIRGQNAGLDRWTIAVAGNAAEVGSNAGSNFAINRYSDTGVFISTPISIDRQIGDIALGDGRLRFPTTANPSSDANTLDDYVEGTWAPTIMFGGASIGVTYSLQQGIYVKVGQNVTASGRLTLSAKGTSTGVASIGGLPFVSSSLGYGSSYIGHVSGAASLVGNMTGYITPGGGIALTMANATTTPNVSDVNFTATTSIIFGAAYRTNT